jgi:acyl carrier protein
MELNEILLEVNNIFKEVLDEENIFLSFETTADDIEEWDSLSHVQLIVAIEKKFSIRFTSTEIQEFKNIGSLCEAVKNKI